MVFLLLTFFYYYVNIYMSLQDYRAISSAGRAGALQALGRRFNPVIAQKSFPPKYGNMKI